MKTRVTFRDDRFMTNFSLDEAESRIYEILYFVGIPAKDIEVTKAADWRSIAWPNGQIELEAVC